MRIIARSTLRAFWEMEPRSERPLTAWHAVTAKARWANPSEVKRSFNTVDFVGDDRAVFDVGGNKYRIVAAIDYRRGMVFIKWVGDHKAYDRINARTVRYGD